MTPGSPGRSVRPRTTRTIAEEDQERHADLGRELDALGQAPREDPDVQAEREDEPERAPRAGAR